MKASISAALRKPMAKRLTEFLLGSNIHAKMSKIIYMKVYFGTRLKPMFGKMKELKDLKHLEYMKHTLEW